MENGTNVITIRYQLDAFTSPNQTLKITLVRLVQLSFSLYRKEDKMNEQLYEQASEAIAKLFSDKSVSQEQARENLESLIGEIEIMLDSMEET